MLSENVGGNAKLIDEDENAEDDVDATDGAVEKALTETAVKPSKVALGAKYKSSKTRKVSGKPVEHTCCHFALFGRTRTSQTVLWHVSILVFCRTSK